MRRRLKSSNRRSGCHGHCRLTWRQDWPEQRIEVTDLLSHMKASGNGVRWIIEGAGGVLVPLNERDLMVDLMVRIAVPVLVVARTSLGTINHTLLTLHALRARRARHHWSRDGRRSFS